MDIIIVSGFLGSGKTTLILETIDKLVSLTNKKVAVIVNDFGDIGIDSKVMDKYGLSVQEIRGGCVCCALRGDLLDTVEILSNNYKPEIIIIEPTGIADPANIQETLKYADDLFDRSRIIEIVDAERFIEISESLSIPFKSHIQAADIVILNKIDKIENVEKDRIIAFLRSEMGFMNDIVPASARNAVNLDEVVDAMVIN